jgi:hypothetical protein
VLSPSVFLWSIPYSILSISLIRQHKFLLRNPGERDDDDDAQWVIHKQVLHMLCVYVVPRLLSFFLLHPGSSVEGNDKSNVAKHLLRVNYCVWSPIIEFISYCCSTTIPPSACVLKERIYRCVRAFEFSFLTHSPLPDPFLVSSLSLLPSIFLSLFRVAEKSSFQPRQRKSADPSGLSSKLLPFFRSSFYSTTAAKMLC